MILETIFPPEWLTVARNDPQNHQLLELILLTSAYIEDQRLSIFLPAYTVHGVDHLHQVAANISKLSKTVTGTNPGLFTSSSYCCLMLAIALHDCGMMLSAHDLSLWLEDDNSLLQEWKMFITEIQHWEPAEIEAKLGKDVQVPTSENFADMNLSSLPVVGEFLRKIHPEYPLYLISSSLDRGSNSFASAFRATFSRLSGQQQGLAKLAAHIACSHGSGLRAYLGTIAGAFGKAGLRETRRIHGVPAAYLAALLRLGDYIDFRGYSSQYFHRRFSPVDSAISVLEHSTMEAFSEPMWCPDRTPVLDLEFSTDNPWVNQNVESYVKGIQEQLDFSWAVISECYSQADDTRCLSVEGLSIREVKSSNTLVTQLDASYFRKPLRVTIDKSHLLYLLAKPLYNYDYRYAFREIVSNAHDAVAELPVESQKLLDGVGICLKIDSDGDAITIEDFGVGMSISDLEEFYLKIGGRLRAGIEWKKTSLKDGISYPFSSRFGVGVIALFMLGEHIVVNTKKLQSEGVEFLVTPTSSELIAQKSARTNQGTSISISSVQPEITEMFDASIRPLVIARRPIEVLSLTVYSRLLMYFPYSFGIQLKCNDLEPIRLPSVDELLSSSGQAWTPTLLPGPRSETVHVSCLPFGQRTLVYNGIALTVDKHFSWPDSGFVAFVRDPSNAFEFDLPKRCLRDVDMEKFYGEIVKEQVLGTIHSTWTSQDYLPLFDGSVRFKNEAARSLLQLKRCRWGLSPVSKGEGWVPLFYFSGGKAKLLTKANLTKEVQPGTNAPCIALIRATASQLPKLMSIRSVIPFIPILDSPGVAVTNHLDGVVRVDYRSKRLRVGREQVATRATVAERLREVFPRTRMTDDLLEFTYSSSSSQFMEYVTLYTDPGPGVDQVSAVYDMLINETLSFDLP